MSPIFGPAVRDNATEFRLWAPGAEQVQLVRDGQAPTPLERSGDGWWKALVPGSGPGTRYRFRIGDLDFPDPASRRQDGGTAGWSVVCPPLPPSGRAQALRPWHQAIVCEVHVGTASPEGSFKGLRDRLEHFRDAGYTALEIMPVNAFPGQRNWGYDGTLLFAPAEAYGSRDDLRALVDRAHELGLGMVLDVVYNHFGDFDNFLERYCPEWFDQHMETPWGPGIDFTKECVRRFYYENARMWLEEFDFDGLRFDAVHEIGTTAREQFLGDLAKSARAAKRDAWLIIENVNNMASWLDREASGGPVDFTAQWNDDYHHVLHFLATGEDRNGYQDGSKDPVADLEKAMADGFVHDGEARGESDGTTRNEPAARLPPDAFVCFVQNHDQIGNRADARRLPDRLDAARLDFLHFVTMLAPQVPLFFMGEEAHMRTLFPYFIDLPENAAGTKRRDRYTQMRESFDEQVEDGDLPDPNAPETFERARLDWTEFDLDERRAALDRFRTLAAWRREHVWPLSASPCTDARSGRQGAAIVVSWLFEAGVLSMALNPSSEPVDIACVITAPPVSTGTHSRHGESLRLEAWSAVCWHSPASD
ncbi:DUF3459 domain-containing protein [Devosia salina]|uniref:Malto-oligosyltrehalose trehalohydrolase n=1 Tax=Devosia salina TaxID=2860336 RepID=A0ABX8WBK5_9HYPH|nr:DUF3459 domain-containing protein [Devosia salina]